VALTAGQARLCALGIWGWGYGLCQECVNAVLVLSKCRLHIRHKHDLLEQLLVLILVLEGAGIPRPTTELERGVATSSVRERTHQHPSRRYTRAVTVTTSSGRCLTTDDPLFDIRSRKGAQIQGREASRGPCLLFVRPWPTGALRKTHRLRRSQDDI
jgi:hypothetical protein